MNRRVSILISILLFPLVVLYGCAPEKPVADSKAQIQTTENSSGKNQTNLTEAWQDNWDKIVKEAKKEGKVVIYSTASSVLRVPLSQPFQAKYGISVEMYFGRGAEVAQKLITERKAGIYITDIYNGGSGTPVRQIKPTGALDPLEPALILPEVKDPQYWYGGLRWVDPPDNTLLSFLAYPNHNLAVNSTLVKPEEIKSYRDILNPRFKGKIVLNDPTIAGSGNKSFRILAWHIMDIDFFRELARLEPVIVRDQRLQVEWLAQGRSYITFAPTPEIVKEFTDAGAPLAFASPAEGTYLSAGNGNVALINKAAHPNAARLFVNWLLSKEGVTVFSKNYGAQSARLDVSTEGLIPESMRKPGVKYWLGGDTEVFQLQEPDQTKVALEIFGPLMKQ